MQKTYRITKEARPTYLYAAISGTIRGENVTSLAREVIRALRNDGPKMLLLDVRNLRMHLDPLSAVSLVRALPKLGDEMKVPTAIVYAPLGQAVVKIYETVLLNRGYSIWIFPDIEGAEACLASMQKTRNEKAGGMPAG